MHFLAVVLLAESVQAGSLPICEPSAPWSPPEPPAPGCGTGAETVPRKDPSGASFPSWDRCQARRGPTSAGSVLAAVGLRGRVGAWETRGWSSIEPPPHPRPTDLVPEPSVLSPPKAGTGEWGSALSGSCFSHVHGQSGGRFGLRGRLQGCGPCVGYMLPEEPERPHVEEVCFDFNIYLF